MTDLFVGLLICAAVLLIGAGRPARSRLRLLAATGHRPRATAPARRVRSQTDLVTALGQLAGLARAGASPGGALTLVAEVVGDDDVGITLRQAASAAALGQPTVDILREQPALAGLAATWSVVSTTGAPVADALERLAVATAAELDATRAVEAVLAGPRATARLLVALPPIAVLLGEAMGVGAVHTLATTGVGHACVMVGGGGMVVGWWWSRRLIAAAA